MHSRSLFSEGDMDQYILKDSNGVISIVPFFSVFDQYYKGDTVDDGEAGAQLYKNGQNIGYVVSDIHSGGVWIYGTPIPQDVIDANTPKKATTFPTTIAKKSEFIERIMFAVDEGKLINYTDKEVIDNDLGKDLYSYKNGEIIHDLGGRVYIKKNEDMVSIVYENIPKGEECHNFYYVNAADLWGFATYVDGSSANEELCNPTGKNTVTIEFRGSIIDIKREAKSWRAEYAPRYSN